MRISEALADIVGSLTTAGITTTAEPNNLELPGALILPGPIEFAYLGAEDYDMTFEVYLVTRSHSTQVEIMEDLQDLLEKFRTVYAIKEVQPMALPNPTGSPIPGLLINLTATITKD